jgi:hypothetical protein
MDPGPSGSEQIVRQSYEVRLNGLVPTSSLIEALGDVEVAQHELRTVVTGSFPDQAALYSFLHRLRAYGLEVVEVHQVSAGTPSAVADPPSSADEAGSRS